MITTSNLTFKRLGSMVLTFLMVFSFAVATAAPAHAEVNIVSNIVANPDPFNPYLTSAEISFDLSQDAYVSMYIEKSDGTPVRTIIEDAKANAGHDYLMWDGKDDNNAYVVEGTYNIEVVADNYYRDLGTAEVSYQTVQAPNITSLDADPNTFDPYGQNTTVNYSIDEESTFTRLDVYKGSVKVATLIPTSEQGDVRPADNYAEVWDGRDDSNVIVDEGTYTVQLTVENSGGHDLLKTPVVVDYGTSQQDEEPEITDVDVDPYRFDPDDTDSTLEFHLNTCADVRVTVMDEDDDEVVELEDRELCEGDHDYDWDGEDDYNDQVRDGYYYFRVFAENNGGEDAVHVDVRVDDGYNNNEDREPEITRVDVDPEVFDPYDEEAELTFRLNTCADVTIEVRDDDNDVVRELLDDERLCSGDHDYDWDGEDDGDDRVRQDEYEFYIRAENSEGNDSARADVEVDYNGHSFDDEDQCAGYNDVDVNDPYCDAIEYVSSRGVFDGYPDGNFRPYQSINRVEATKVILVGFDYPLHSPDGTNSGFWDVAREAWYMIYLRTGVDMNIVQGYPDGSFQPARIVNRVELLKIFLESAQVATPYCAVSPYVDTPIQADTAWYMGYVCYAKTYDIVDPDYNNRFNPAKPMTRGDVALLFYNFANRGTGTVGSSSSSSSSYGDPEIRNLQLSDYTVDPGENVRIEYYLEAAADVVVEIVDDDDDVVRTLVDDKWRSKGNHSVTWDGEDDDGDELDDGEYTVRIEADNNDGFDRDELSFEVDEDSSSSSIRISNLEVDDDRFDPDREDLRISFRINQDADVTVKVYDDDNDRVAMIWDERNRDDGTYTIVWNGTDDDGDTLSDGDYTIKVIAVDENDEDEEDRDEVDFEIDT